MPDGFGATDHVPPASGILIGSMRVLPLASMGSAVMPAVMPTRVRIIRDGLR